MRPRRAPEHRRSKEIAFAHQLAEAKFAQRVISWQKRHGRNDLPWQQRRDPYAVWVSEIMLQQTQVATVVPYYERFMQRFPDVASLAAASSDEVMRYWSGLGYYSRARNLHRAAMQIVSGHAGRFPRDVQAIAALPGVGRSTAAAIAALAFGARCAILDGNVKRVLCRYFAIEGDPGAPAIERALWMHAEQLLPRAQADRYAQGMMDLGATVCLRHHPQCDRCPLSQGCMALCTGRTAELPHARKRPVRPERSIAMLLLRDGGRVLMEKRPAPGIWGGLWSLPEAEIGADLRALIARRFAVQVGDMRAMPVLNHGFTHFRLRIEPWQVRVRALQSSPEAPGTAWLTLAQARASALPAPIRILLSADES